MEAMPSSSPEMADLAPRRWSGQRAGAAAPGGGARPRDACSPRGQRRREGAAAPGGGARPWAACSPRRNRRREAGAAASRRRSWTRSSACTAARTPSPHGSRQSWSPSSGTSTRSCSGTTRRVRALELHHAAVGCRRGRVPGKGQQGAAPATGAMRRPEGVWVGWRLGRRKGK